MRKVNYLPSCKIGSIELERTQALIQENIRKLTEPLYSTIGLLVAKDLAGNLASDWLVSIVNTGQIRINAGKAFLLDANNELTSVQMAENTLITTPDVDGVYKVLLRHAYTNFEKGTVSINNNTNIVNGVGTEFTKVLAINRRMFINGVAVVVANVVSDTQLIISGNYGGVDVSGVNYKVGGYFSEYPLNEVDNYIYQNDAVSIILTTGAKPANDIYLADITITNGWVLEVEDKRTQFLTLFHEYPQLTADNLRDRRETIWRASAIAANTINAEITGITPQILATDAHVGTFRTKFALSFYKAADDTTLKINFHPTYTDTGNELITADKVKFQVRLDVDATEGTAEYLDVNELSHNISNLADGYHTLYFKLSKAATAFNLSIKINEVYKTGGSQFIV